MLTSASVVKVVSDVEFLHFWGRNSTSRIFTVERCSPLDLPLTSVIAPINCSKKCLRSLADNNDQFSLKSLMISALFIGGSSSDNDCNFSISALITPFSLSTIFLISR